MDIELVNKGISGNEVCDVLARVENDVIALKPAENSFGILFKIVS